MSVNIETEQLIAEVQLRPELWDSSCTQHKDRGARAQAWLQVCQALFLDFDDFSVPDKRDIDKQVQQRWKTARDAYTRCKLSHRNLKTGGPFTPGMRTKYAYYDIMHFLDKKYDAESEDIKTCPIKTFKMKFETNELPSTECDDDVPPKKPEEGNISNCIYRTEKLSSFEHKKTNKNNIKEKNEENAKSINESNTMKINENNSFDMEMLKMFKDSTKLLQNDDMAFFYSLLPITQTFNMQQKLEFRNEVLKKAMEINNYDDKKSVRRAPSIETNVSISQQHAEL